MSSVPAAKILLLGDANVGKTSLRSQFIHHRFSSAYRATVGGDFLTAKVSTSYAPRRLPEDSHDSNNSSVINSDNNRDLFSHAQYTSRSSFSQSAEPETVSMQIWDTAGQERFDSLVRSFFRGTDVAILVYDVTDATSFSHLRKWLDDFINHALVRNPIIVVVGNKIDRRQYRTVSERQAREFAEEAAEAYGLMAPPSFASNPNAGAAPLSPKGASLPTPSFGPSSSYLNSSFYRTQNTAYDDNESIFETPRSPSIMQQNLQNIRQTSPLSNNDSSSGTNINILNTNNNNSNYNNNNNLLGGNNSTSQVPQPAIACFEVSAKDNIDVDKLFTYVADRIVAARREVILDFDAVDAQSPSGSIRGAGGFGTFGGGSIDIGNTNQRKSRSGFGFCC